ncbi:hypothetical protein QUF54_04060 [Candidatus Marithioploca araucensis]|uniref:Uncharacterized protein n=1 Tax=Candidatus Marithioploca araucensis TaxID=70273 RepID=A0ABT7VS57_9GAMM|nr:hypothetical protein [Candidatus Marithioploca araucensis]
MQSSFDIAFIRRFALIIGNQNAVDLTVLFLRRCHELFIDGLRVYCRKIKLLFFG